MDVTRISLNLPFGLGGIEIKPNEKEREAAWIIYVELMTRIAVQPLDPETGVLRETLDSLYSLFKLTRTVLCDAGPDVGRGQEALGHLAIDVLNKGLRPFMSKWHPRLLAYEAKRPENISNVEYEHGWQHYNEMRKELADLQKEMQIYAKALAQIAGAEISA